MPNNDCLKKNSAAESAKLLECACPFWRFWTLNLNLDLNRNPRGSVLPSTLIILAKDAETRFRTLVRWAMQAITHYEILLQRRPHGYGDRN